MNTHTQCSRYNSNIIIVCILLLNTCAVSAGETRPCRTSTGSTWRAVWGSGSICTIPWRPGAAAGRRRPTAGTAGTARRSSRMDSGTACWSPCQAYRRTPPRRWCCGRTRFGPERLNAADRTTAIHTIHLCCCGRDERACYTLVVVVTLAILRPYCTGRYCWYYCDTCGERQKKRDWNAFHGEAYSYIIQSKTCRGRVFILFFFPPDSVYMLAQSIRVPSRGWTLHVYRDGIL